MVPISDFLAEGALTVAAENGRAVSSQIEHWAWIGKAVESHVSATTVSALIRCDGNLALLEDSAERERIEAELEQVRLLFNA
jgi:hypothetical protein